MREDLENEKDGFMFDLGRKMESDIRHATNMAFSCFSFLFIGMRREENCSRLEEVVWYGGYERSAKSFVSNYQTFSDKT